MPNNRKMYVPQDSVIEQLREYMLQIMDHHKNHREGLRDKMRNIAQAYQRYQETGNTSDGNTTCGTSVLRDGDMELPIVVSQVNSYVAYLADVFLSGYPLFPVVSSPKNVKYAEMLESILEAHSEVGHYPKELLMALFDLMLYDFAGIDTEWTNIPSFSISYDEILNERGLSGDQTEYTEIKRVDPYNLIFDDRVDISDVSRHGDYAGYVTRVTRIQLKTIMQRLSEQRHLIRKHTDLAFKSSLTEEYYIPAPIVSKWNESVYDRKSSYWTEWFGRTVDTKTAFNDSGMYDVTKLYLRILPDDFKMPVLSPNTPQIWATIWVNHEVLIGIYPVHTPYQSFPLIVSTSIGDGLNLQSHSVGSQAMDYQEAMSTLMNVRFSSARRAVHDRAIYDPGALDPDDVNNPHPAAKIPYNGGSIIKTALRDTYYQIPFDSRGLDNILSDVGMLSGMLEEQTGLNDAARGSFVKGNKTVTEWQDVMGNADSRMRLPALTIEYSLFLPLKTQFKHNIYLYGNNAHVIGARTGEEIEANIREMQQVLLKFKIADGFNPKSKMASTEMLQVLLQVISSSEYIAQQLGPALPSMVVHIAQLSGVKGLDEYLPTKNQQPIAIEAQSEGTLND